MKKSNQHAPKWVIAIDVATIAAGFIASYWVRYELRWFRDIVYDAPLSVYLPFLALYIILLPIVLLWDPSGEDWRGVIAPRDWDRWWESYQRFIVHYARLAQEAGAEMFSIGSELLSTEHMRHRWQEVIRAVRAVYKGKLLYSANWDHYEEVSFWDDLDLIGMTAYYTLSRSRNPTLEELRESWRPIKKRILAWQRARGQRIVFTEVGYPSQDGCAREPWNYYGSSIYDWREQYLCLQAFFETWRDEPAVAAVIVWKWEEPTGPNDLNYTPKGKPTEELIRRWLLGGPLGGPPTGVPPVPASLSLPGGVRLPSPLPAPDKPARRHVE